LAEVNNHWGFQALSSIEPGAAFEIHREGKALWKNSLNGNAAHGEG